MNNFEELYAVNVNEHKEDKNGLSYLSWSWAWAEFKKRNPTATYQILKFDGLPYVYDEKTGYMCYTRITVDDLTHEMWLPVMDGANNAMKSEPYDFTTKWGKKFHVEAATMFDINKTIMRCLVKNMAMFGLGLYIYAGEDLPDEIPVEEEKQEETKAEPKAKKKPTAKKISKSELAELENLIEETSSNYDGILNYYKIDKLNALSLSQFEDCKSKLERKRNAQ